MNPGHRDSAVVQAFKLARIASGKARCDVCRWKPPRGLSLLHDEPLSMLHAHHVVPIACGGEDHERNLVLVCPTHHALSHKIGRVTVTKGSAYSKWAGPTTPAQLLRELRMLEKEPEQWDLYIKGGRDFAGLVRSDEDAEAQRRRSNFGVYTTGTTTRHSEEISDAG